VQVNLRSHSPPFPLGLNRILREVSYWMGPPGGSSPGIILKFSALSPCAAQQGAPFPLPPSRGLQAPAAQPCRHQLHSPAGVFWAGLESFSQKPIEFTGSSYCPWGIQAFSRDAEPVSHSLPLYSVVSVDTLPMLGLAVLRVTLLLAMLFALP
jgi:hypothetical protein